MQKQSAELAQTRLQVHNLETSLRAANEKVSQGEKEVKQLQFGKSMSSGVNPG